MKINNKFNQVFEKNDGLTIVLNILNEESPLIDGFPEDLTGNYLKFFKYAPITSQLMSKEIFLITKPY